MENKLEQLLNSLIKKGWNVFGHKDRINAEKCNYIEGNYYNFDNHNISISLRELTSIDSGLWQFVCENGMVNINYGNIREYYSEQENGGIYIRKLNGEDNYEYRLIESALKDESELESFILDNIKVDVESK